MLPILLELPLVANAEALLAKASITSSSPSWDLFIVIFCIAAIVLYGLTLGRDRIVLILVSTYIGLAITNALPFLTDDALEFMGLEARTVRLAVFFGSMILVFLLFSRAGVLDRLGSNGDIWMLVVVSILQLGFLVSAVLTFLPVETQEGMSEILKLIFISDIGRTAWLVLPLGSLFLLRK